MGTLVTGVLGGVPRHLRPDVCGHVNGGTTSLDDDGLTRLLSESTMAMQLVQAGWRRSLHRDPFRPGEEYPMNARAT